jgi:hypothetical protein
MIVDYFETVAKDVQSKVVQHCTVEIAAYPESLCLDTREHFQPQATLRFQIRHARGLDQPSGPAEERALDAVREALRELGVKSA